MLNDWGNIMDITITYRAGPDQNGDYYEKHTTVQVDELLAMDYGPTTAIALVASIEARKFWQGIVFSGALEEQ